MHKVRKQNVGCLLTCVWAACTSAFLSSSSRAMCRATHSWRPSGLLGAVLVLLCSPMSHLLTLSSTYYFFFAFPLSLTVALPSLSHGRLLTFFLDNFCLLVLLFSSFLECYVISSLIAILTPFPAHEFFLSALCIIITLFLMICIYIFFLNYYYFQHQMLINCIVLSTPGKVRQDYYNHDNTFFF